MTKDSVHSHQLAQLMEKMKPEPSPLKKLLEKPAEKEVNKETGTPDQEKTNDKNRIKEKQFDR